MNMTTVSFKMISGHMEYKSVGDGGNAHVTTIEVAGESTSTFKYADFHRTARGFVLSFEGKVESREFLLALRELIELSEIQPP